MKILALTTSHNRRKLTLRALRSLRGQIVSGIDSLNICVVDDGSSDGTGEAVRAAFPGVTVLNGTGDLYWAGGMRFGWVECGAHQDPDYLLAFNDDVCLADHAIATLISVAHRLESDGCVAFAVSGALQNPETGEVAYGGLVRNSAWHPLRFGKISPTDDIQECDTVNMNLTLVSRKALQLVGFLSSEFSHALADFDFGLRLRAAGGRVVLAPRYLGECRVNSALGTWAEEGLNFSERWRRMTGTKGQPPKERAAFYRRHAGVLWPCYWALPYVRIPLESGAMYVKRAFTGHRQ